MHRPRYVPLFWLLVVIGLASALQARQFRETINDDEFPFEYLDENDGRHRESEREDIEERIETERHDFTQSTRTVGRGVTQWEAGYTYFYNDKESEIEQTHATPEMLLRFGLTDEIEFRIRWNYAWRFVDEGNNVDSAQDVIWSFKFAVTEQECLQPESALEVRGTAPTGGSDWTTGRVEAGLDYIYSWELTERLALYGSTGFGTSGLGDFSLLPEEPASDHFIVWTQSVALGTELTENITMYTETFGLFSHALADDFSFVFFNVGVDYYVTNNFVLDVRAGLGLTSGAEDFFSGIGGGYRY